MGNTETFDAVVVGGGPAGAPGPAAQGGGVYSTVTLNFFQNSVVAGNTAASHPDCHGTFTSLGFNLVGIATGSSGFTAPGDLTGNQAIPLNPLLGPLCPASVTLVP